MGPATDHPPAGGDRWSPAIILVERSSGENIGTARAGDE